MSLYKPVILLALLSLMMISCEKVFIDPPANNQEAIFEDLWKSFQEEYAPFEERKIDWQKEYNTFRPMVKSGTSDDELFNIITQMLKKLDDGHVSLTAPGKDIFFSNKIRNELLEDELFNLSVVKSYMEEGYKEGEENSYVYKEW